MAGMLAGVDVNKPPKNFRDAMNREDRQEWAEAYDSEYQGFFEHGTLNLVRPELSVLKSHFKEACIVDCKQLLSKSEKRSVHTLGARGVGPLGGTVREDCFVCWKVWGLILKI